MKETLYTLTQKSKEKMKYALSLILLISSFQTYSQQDTIFYFAAPDISSAVGDSPVHLRLMSYSQPASVTITQPANGGFTPINVNLAANSVSSIDLSPFLADIESPAADVIATTGIKIESDELITAYYELSNGTNKEVFSLKGNKAIGTNFYTPFQEQWDNASISPSTFSSIEIVATQDNTTIAITPKTDITGHSVGSTFNIVLDEGETYSARDTDLNASTSLSGSIVAADKPVSVTVFTGALSNGGCTSSMGDQITPTDYLGTDFIIHKGTSSDDRIFILATQNSTSITIENQSTTNTLINWSETYEYDLNDTYNYVHTSKPVYLWHASGKGCNLAGAQLPNAYCAGKYDQAFTRSTTDSLGLVLYVRNGYQDDFTLNGNTSLITSGGFTTVPGTSGEFVMGTFYFNTTDVPVGSYNIVSNSGDVFGMGILNGEDGIGSGYAYISEFNSYPFVDAGLDATICQNVPFNINGIVGGGDVTGSWSGTGFGSFEYSLDSLTNIYHASPVDTIVSPIELILTSTGPCPEQKDTITIDITPAPIVNAGADQIVCANNADVSIDGSITGGSSTGTWTTTGSGTFSPDPDSLLATYTPSAADTAAGFVELILTSTASGACTDVSDTMMVTITDAPKVNIPDDTIFVCSNNPDFNLSGTVSGGTTTGKWTTNGSGIFNPDNLTLNCSYEPSPTDVNGGEITIYLQSTNNGSCDGDIDSVQIVFTNPPVANAGPDIFACTNEPVVNLSGAVSGPTTTGVWSGGAGTYDVDSTDLNATYTPTATEITNGSVTLTLTTTNNGNCLSDNDAVDIDFVTPPFANFNFNEVCLNDTTYFTDFSLDGFGNIIDWTYDFGDGNGANTQNTAHIYSSSGVYNASLIIESDAGCFDTINQNVTVHELPVASYSYTSSCNNDQVIVDFNDESTIGSGSLTNWYYDFGGMGSQAVQNPSQLFVGAGNFTITQIVTSSEGCQDTSVQVLNVPPRPIAGFFYNTSGGLNVGAEFTFVDTSSYTSSWNWDLGNGETSTDQNPSTVYFENGNYEVTLVATGPLGCIDSSSQTITINTVTKEINLLIPNAISPNGDGKNDVWKLEFVDLVNPEAEIVIVNRWGQTVFQSIGYSDPWDGTYNGELVPEGNYYYVIKLSENEEDIYKGAILVLISGNN